jgi:hypothetical protein
MFPNLRPRTPVFLLEQVLAINLEVLISDCVLWIDKSGEAKYTELEELCTKVHERTYVLELSA